MELKTERLLLRSWQESDAPLLYEYAKDERIGSKTGFPPHQNEEESLEVIRTIFANEDSFAITFKEEPEKIIGCISVKWTEGEPRIEEMDPEDAEIGYWLGVPFWGQGIMPEAFDEVLRYCFMERRVPAVWCGYFAGNEPSKRVQEKMGMTWQLVKKDQLIKLLGIVVDEHFTKITKEEWLVK